MQGKVIFVSYGNQEYYKSLDRIRKEAAATQVFDRILVYTDKDLPVEITSHVLMRHKRGGGYWVWKPWAILQAMNVASDNDIIVYSDSGNTLYKHPQWFSLLRKLDKYDALLFYNGGIMDQWSSKAMMDYFNLSLYGGGKYYQIIGNISLFRKQSQQLISDWLDVMLSHPEIVYDVPADKIVFENPHFIEHRHDQAVLSGLVYSKYRKSRILVLPQFSESLKSSGQAVFNSRISDSSVRNPAIPEKTIISLIKAWIIRPYRRMKMKYLNIKADFKLCLTQGVH